MSTETSGEKAQPLTAQLEPADPGSVASPNRLPIELARLQDYLPPYLWDKLAQAAPSRGVLLNVLDRVRSILHLLYSYLPSHLVQEKTNDPKPGRASGQLNRGTLLFSDVSGFTALSERLASQGQQGAERLTDMINTYFDTMLDILAQSDGILLKFAGDALLAYFPHQAHDKQAAWAVRAGQRMMNKMSDFSAIETPLGPVALRMKIGISTGCFLAASVGSIERMEYVVLGQSVAQTMSAESHAQAGQIIIDRATAAALEPPFQVERLPAPEEGSHDEHEDDFYFVQPAPAEALGDFEIRASPTRRARSHAPWIAETAEIIDEIKNLICQLETLTPFLPSELVQRIVENIQQRRVPSEYRQTVVIFINFRGLETLFSAWEMASIERESEQAQERSQTLADLLSDYFKTMHKVIANYDGVVTRIDPYRYGSKMLVLFGAPVMHEDEPQRAIRAALDMNRALAALNNRWQPKLAGRLPAGPGSPLIQQQIGITQGPTFAGQAGTTTRREYTVMGDDVNLSARLMSAAQAGQILMSQHIYEKAEEHFRTTRLEPIRVKGKSKPIPIYQVDGLRDDRLARRLKGHGPLAGRETELERGKTILAQAMAGQGSLLEIRGPAGIGKSRLADALAAEAMARRARIFLCECEPYLLDAPYAPWISLLNAMTAIGPNDTPAARSEKLLGLLTKLGLDPNTFAASLLNLLGLQGAEPPRMLQQPSPQVAPQDSAKPKTSLFDQLGQKVAKQADPSAPADQTEKPKLDLWQLTRQRRKTQAGQMWQRLEAKITAKEQERLFQAICELVERQSASAPLMIVFDNAQWMDATSRELLNYLGKRINSWPVLITLAQRDEQEKDSPYPSLTLGALPAEATDAIVKHLIKDAASSVDFNALSLAIHNQSEGNPLFIEEIVRWLQQSGQTDPNDLRAGLRASSNLQELIISRLDGLPYNQRDTVRAASVVGNEFCADDLHPLVEENTLPLLNTSLDGLEEAQLAVMAASGVNARYAFQQMLVREIVYDHQSFAQRRELHARVAAHLETRHADDIQRQSELLAFHFELAERWLPAARYLILCGHKARQCFAYAHALNSYKKALAALEHLPAGQAESDAQTLKVQAHEGQGDIAILTGNWAAATTSYAAALDILTEKQTPEEKLDQDQCKLILKRALVLPLTGQAQQAKACARQVWEAHHPNSEKAAAASLAWLLWRSGDPIASDWIEQAQKLGAPQAERWESQQWEAKIEALLTDLAGDWETAQKAYLKLDQPSGAALAACRLGDQRLHQGDIAAAMAAYGQAEEIWEREKDAPGLALADYRQAEAFWQSADTSAAADELEEALMLLGDNAAAQDDRQVIQSALQIVGGEQTKEWPGWRWQLYDDAFRILLLFRP